jgi:SAM-dependent methyltransferase
MKLVSNCVCCSSAKLVKKIGLFAPFISHRVMDYPLSKLMLGESDIGFPTLYTNSMHCEVCDFVFSQLRFEDEEMARIYKDYRNDSYAEIRNIFEPGYLELNMHIGKSQSERDNRQLVMSEFLSSEIDVEKIHTVLDHGGDAGQHIPKFFENTEKYVYEVSGVDPVEGVKSVDNLNNMKTIDFIMNCNVLEHVPYPKKILKEIKNLCHKDTVLFIDVPSERTEENNYPSFFHEHINYFNEKSISTLLKSEGFQLLKMQTFSIDFGWCQAKSTFVIAKPAWIS